MPASRHPAAVAAPTGPARQVGCGRPRLALACLAALLLAACASSPPARYAGSARAPRPVIADPSAGTEEISIQAMSLVGTPYRYGGNTPDSGFDCSGLVRYVVARAANVNLPRTTEAMGVRGAPLERSQVAAGDLVFFNTTGRPNSHVGIYVGQNRFVHAPSTGGTVRLEDMSKSYWASRYNGARRVSGPLDPGDSPVMVVQSTPAPASSSTPIRAATAQPADDDDPIAAFANR